MSTRRPIRLGTRTMFRGAVFGVRREVWRLPQGESVKRDIVRHPGSVVIVPFVDRRHVVLIRQFRMTVGRALWELPAGTLEAGEIPRACAARELMEETGFRAGRFRRVVKFLPSPGFCSEVMYVYAAWRLRNVPRPSADDDPLTVHVLAFSDVCRMIERGDIIDAKTIIGILQVRYHRTEFLV